MPVCPLGSVRGSARSRFGSGRSMALRLRLFLLVEKLDNYGLLIFLIKGYFSGSFFIIELRRKFEDILLKKS
jgi:hypothetical protein